MDTVKIDSAMPNKCPQCGTPLDSGALGGLCPACLLAQGALHETGTGGQIPPFNPPSVAEIAPLFPQLEIIELIGKGGMGAVYKARQKQLDRIVALKILPPGVGHDATFAERFAREARALAKLNHPGIVTLYEFGETSGQFYFLMEFVDGVNLRQLLNAGRISPREALAIVPQICDALQFAHDHGIVHRDIKPENILLDRLGRVKVADFGLAKIMGGNAIEPAASGCAAGSPALTDAGKVMGTPQYMSPEQIKNPGEVDNRADIYALGVVFYQMLTGELPGKKIEPPSRKVQIDVRLDEIVLRALERRPELRYQQVSEVRTCVETIVNSGSSSTAPHPAATAKNLPRKTGLVRLLEILFDITFTSPTAIALINLSTLGSLCFLGYLPFPGCHRLFGFSGLYGLIGFGFLFEIVARSKPPASAPILLRGQIFRRSALVSVLVWLVIFMLAATVTSLLPPTYLGVARVKIAGVGSAQSGDPYLLETELERLRSEELLEQVAAKADLKMRWKSLLSGSENEQSRQLINQLRSAINLRPVTNSALSLIDIYVYSRSATEVADIANTMARIYCDQTQAKFVEEARIPERPVRPDVFMNLAVGASVAMVAALIAGGLSALFYSRKNRRVAAFASMAKEPQAVLPWVAFSFACLGGIIGSVSFLFWPCPPQLLVWAIPVVAILGVTLGILSRHHQFGRYAIIIGSINLAIWLIIFAVTFSQPGPGTVVKQSFNYDPTNAAYGFGTEVKPQVTAKTVITSDGSSSAQNQTRFAPVIERTIMDSKANFENDSARTNASTMIDLDSGILFSGPSDMWRADAAAQKNWMSAEGIDALGVIPGVDGLVGLDMKTIPMPSTGWDEITADSVSAQLEKTDIHESIPLNGMGDFPPTCLFQTREGGKGILQIRGFTENPRGVRIRYKLVQQARQANANQNVILSFKGGKLVATDTNSHWLWSMEEYDKRIGESNWLIFTGSNIISTTISPDEIRSNDLKNLPPTNN